MTSNQVNYWQNVERERANRAQELLTQKQQDIDRYRAFQKDKEIAMQNLMNIMEHGKRGDIGYQYGMDATGTGNYQPNEIENMQRSMTSVSHDWADMANALGNIFFPLPIGFNLKI